MHQGHAGCRAACAGDRQAPALAGPGRKLRLVRDFVGTLADAGCRHFIVHARNAWLQGLSSP